MGLRFVTGLVLISLLGSACVGDEQSDASTSLSAPPASTSAPSTSTSPQSTLWHITDPKGDAGVSESLGYLDVLSADVSGGNITSGAPYTFSFALSEPIPATFDVPAPYDAIGWEFCIDTDPSTEPSGYPFAASTAMPCEFIVMEISQGGNEGGHVAKVTGTLIDRRPLLDGKKATTSSIPRTMDVQLSSSSSLGFSVFKNGAEVLVQIPARSIGRPWSFEWVLFTSELTLPLGNDDFTNLDEAPDGNFASPAGGFTW